MDKFTTSELKKYTHKIHEVKYNLEKIYVFCKVV